MSRQTIWVNLSTLAHAPVGKSEDIVVEQGPLELDELKIAFLRGTLHCVRVEKEILAKGLLETEVETECTRCLTTFWLPLQLEIDESLSLPGAGITAERPVRLAESGWADIAPLVRENILLNMPINPLCSPDCKGLCPVCGGNLNRGECTCDTTPSIDPRWAMLGTLLDEMEKE